MKYAIISRLSFATRRRLFAAAVVKMVKRANDRRVASGDQSAPYFWQRDLLSAVCVLATYYGFVQPEYTGRDDRYQQWVEWNRRIFSDALAANLIAEY